jgi:ankyrin repeat protein
LLDQGHANPNMKDEFQRTVLHLSCDFSNRRDYNEYFKILMRHNANIAELDFKGRTPLHYMYIKKNRRHECDYFDPLRTEQCHLEVLLNAQTKESFDINL